jgi:predicted MFS family arabinose efflux permease
MLPRFPSQAAGRKVPFSKVVAVPGIKPVLVVTLTYILAHNILYTYIVPFLAPIGLSDKIDIILLVFGMAALVGIWLIGLFIDRWMRELVIISTVLFALASLGLGLGAGNVIVAYGCIALWGLAYGGTATLFQTASAKAAGNVADIAQSIIVTVWNIAILGGGVVGGIVLHSYNVMYFPWILVALLVFALLVVWNSRIAGFPSSRRS